MASRLPPSSPLFAWAAERASSCYHSGINEEERTRGGSIPMLPHQLAHDELSLNAGVARNALSLFLVLSADGRAVLHRAHARTRLVNKHATNYAAFGQNAAAPPAEGAAAAASPPEAATRAAEAAAARILSALAGLAEPEELVAHTMIEYNAYFGGLLALRARAAAGGGGGDGDALGLLRAQPVAGVAAAYAFSPPSGEGLLHASLELTNYAHCSSPIRRYADLHNQHVLHQSLAGGAAGVRVEGALAALNARVACVAQYHARVDTMELAYRCREAPTVFRGRVETDEESPMGGASLLVYAEKRRVRVPLHDSFFAEPMAALFGGDGGAAPPAIGRAKPASAREITVELCGVLKAGRTQLRVRVPQVAASEMAAGAGLQPVSRGLRPPGSAFDKPAAATTASGGAAAADDTLFALLLEVGVPEATLSLLQSLDVGRAALLDLSVDDVVGLSGVERGVAETILQVACASAPPRAAAPRPPPAAAAPPAAAPPPLAAHPSPGSDAVYADDSSFDDGEAFLEVDPEMAALLSKLSITTATSHKLVTFGLGKNAMRLLTSTDLCEITGCGADEASAIVAGVAADAAADAADAAAIVAAAEADGSHRADGSPITKEDVDTVLGYGIDDFQERSLAVIVQPQLDLLAMAPTGSGKTAVALIAILQAFRRGQKAVYTSPIKALSNQKYAEFKAWFRAKGLQAGVTLLTGDIKIRSPPGTKRELIICTSEILRNKLVRAAGKAPESTAIAVAAAAGHLAPGERAALPPPAQNDVDLMDLGCLISDEIHYINDVERGSVWEETLMHLPPSVQLVALSATLKDPRSFLSWISSTRGRPAELVRRLDRHVPLHVGGLERRGNSFVEFYGTHGDVAGQFSAETFATLRAEILDPPAKDAAAAAAAAAARGERQGEKDAQRAAYEGRGGGGGGGRSGRGAGGKGGKGGGKGGKGGGRDQPNFGAECLRLGKALAESGKLPGIVFAMSRKRCVEGAHAAAPLNLSGGQRPDRSRRPHVSDAAAREAWDRFEEQRRETVRAAQRALRAMHRKHLQRYMPELGELEAYRDVMALLERGVAYHHSGMLPVLREFVELCFQERLVKLVFATETLAVGVNMPARTVVFSQLDKPNDGDRPGHRSLRPDEFWQMAGRAGRRGMDVLGYVVYAPTLSVAGLRNIASANDLRQMLTGEMPAATSRLEVNKPFVLRHLARGYGVEVLSKTLLADQLRRETEQMKAAAAQAGGGGGGPSPELAAAVKRYGELEVRACGGGGISLNPKQQKAVNAELRALRDAHGEAIVSLRKEIAEKERLEASIEANKELLARQWAEASDWLGEYGFLEGKGAGAALTARGRACAAFSDGQPLVVGTVIADRWLDQLAPGEICAWLCMFLQDAARSVGDISQAELKPPVPSAGFEEVLQETVGMAEMLEVSLDRTLTLMMLDWTEHKDITRIAQWIDPHMLGSFVKAVMRVASYLDVVREVLLGLGAYETHNRLDNFMDLILGGLVTNESLYLRIADTD